MSEQLAASKSSGGHATLARMAGEWEGTIATWFEPDSIADQSPIRGTIRTIMDGRFLLHEYTSSFGGKPTEGMVIYAYMLAYNRFQSAWIDSFHTGTAIMFSEGEKDSARLDVLGHYDYVTPEFQQTWGWRTAIEQPEENKMIITAYNITPDGAEQKATETVYTRIK